MTAAALLATIGVCVSLDTLVLSLAGRAVVPGLSGTSAVVATVAVILAPLLSILLARWGHRNLDRISWHVAMPMTLAWVGFISLVNFTTSDVTAGTQFFILLPILYAAYHLYQAAAAVVTVVALVLQSALTLTHLPLRDAMHDVVYMWVLLGTISVLVSRWREAQANTLKDLRDQARVDGLTGLGTRMVLEEAAALSLRDETAMILVDLDRLKHINDTYGHPVGDRVIVTVSRVLAELTRPEDVVCRIGGDELAVLLPGCPEPVAKDRAERFVAAVAATPFQVGDTEESISVSVGIAHCTGGECSGFQHLYAAADDSLYRAKAAGRGRVGRHGVEQGVATSC